MREVAYSVGGFARRTVQPLQPAAGCSCIQSP